MEDFKTSQHEIKGTKLLSPYSNITVGPAPMSNMPFETAEGYDVFLNVAEKQEYSQLSDGERTNAEYLWFPIDETVFWNEDSIKGVVKSLNFYYNQNSKIYLHCNKGRNRSPSVAMIWLMSKRNGLEKSASIVAGGNPKLANEFQSNFRKNLMRGFLSKKWLKD